MPETKLLTFTLNDKALEVPQGTTIFQAARRAEVEIPHFCYHPYLPVAGNCRMCLVEVEKSPKLVISCATPVSDGMVVRTDTQKVKKAVRGVLEFLLINHPIDCPVCDQAGECKLQDYYMIYGLHESRVDLSEKVRRRKALDLGPIVLDSERCVLCSRCIRYLSEVTRTNELGFFERGDRTEVAAFLDSKIDGNGYAGNLADICPVGAITSRDFRFRCRVWFLKGTPSICTDCSTGCNIRVDHRNGQVFRFVPRHNPNVNKTWLCDVGRFSYKKLNGPERLLHPMVRRNGMFQREFWRVCVSEIARRMKDARKPLGVLSTGMTNEEIFLAKRLFSATGGALFALNDVGEDTTSTEDFLLRRKDHTPNTTGALRLKIEVLHGEKARRNLLGAFDNSQYSVLLTDEPEILPGRRSDLPFVVALSTHNDVRLSNADIILPISTFVEKEGTFTNFEGRVQRMEKAFPPPGEARSAFEILLELSRDVGIDIGFDDVPGAFLVLSKEHMAFSGLEYGSLGEHGMVLR